MCVLVLHSSHFVHHALTRCTVGSDDTPSNLAGGRVASDPEDTRTTQHAIHLSLMSTSISRTLATWIRGFPRAGEQGSPYRFESLSYWLESEAGT